MRPGKTLIIIDSIINLLLGIILLLYSEPVIKLFGLPKTDLYFYPNILGAVLFGIGIALLIEYNRKGDFLGLGLGGAVSINLSGGIILFLWLVFGKLDVPIQGKIILWILDIILVAISSLEFMTYWKNRRSNNNIK